MSSLRGEEIALSSDHEDERDITAPEEPKHTGKWEHARGNS